MLIKKEITKIDKDGNDKIMKISFKIKLLIALALSGGRHSEKCTDCKSCLDYMITKDDQLIFRRFECKNDYEKEFNKELIKTCANKYEFCNGDINKFILLLRKGVYPYEYMDSCERFDETSLPDKEAFCSRLKIEDITDVDYRHANEVFKTFRLKHLGEIHDLYVQSDYCLQTYLKILETCVLKYMN